MSITSLPDDVLQHVLYYAGRAMRLVCKHWDTLSCDRTREITIYFAFFEQKYLLRLLARRPRVESISFRSFPNCIPLECANHEMTPLWTHAEFNRDLLSVDLLMWGTPQLPKDKIRQQHERTREIPSKYEQLLSQVFESYGGPVNDALVHIRAQSNSVLINSAQYKHRSRMRLPNVARLDLRTIARDTRFCVWATSCADM
jgi:hypothetical protein